MKRKAFILLALAFAAASFALMNWVGGQTVDEEKAMRMMKEFVALEPNEVPGFDTKGGIVHRVDLRVRGYEFDGVSGKMAARLIVVKANLVLLGWREIPKVRLVAKGKKMEARKVREGWLCWYLGVFDRKMLDEMHHQIDAVVVATPDHTHAVASVTAMKLGKHVYCEKPLTYCIYEARVMRKVAQEKKVATQMGNQGMGSSGTRQLIEIIRSGAIGYVREVHLWTDRPIWPQGVDRPKDTPPVPPELNWDLWIGPAPYRPYHPAYHPFRWRGWIDFGTGALGDIGCHVFPLPFLALNLSYPTLVQAISSGHNGETYPRWSIVQYEFPARGDLPPVRLTWYDGGQKPSADLLKDILKGEQIPDNGHLFIGDKGVVFNGRLLPADQFKDYKLPEPTLPRAPQDNHYLEWVQACKTGSPTMSNFDFAGLVTEVVLLGNVALLTGEKIEFEPLTMRAKGCPEAEKYIRREYRKGWSL